MLCLAPIIMVGYAFTIQTDWHQTTDVSAPIVELQSCESGLGLHGKLSTDGLYAGGVHYGFTGQWGDWSLTAQPHVGLSYADHPIPELPMRTQFEVGAEVLAGYGDFRVSIGYWHLSNAGLEAPNTGLDMLTLQTGWRF